MGGGRVDESLEGGRVAEFGVAVEQEGGDVAIGERAGVEFLQVGSEVGEALGVEELCKMVVNKYGEEQKRKKDGPCESHSSPERLQQS
jgi:hypothetical protein